MHVHTQERCVSQCGYLQRTRAQKRTEQDIASMGYADVLFYKNISLFKHIKANHRRDVRQGAWPTLCWGRRPHERWITEIDILKSTAILKGR